MPPRCDLANDTFNKEFNGLRFVNALDIVVDVTACFDATPDLVAALFNATRAVLVFPVLSLCWSRRARLRGGADDDLDDVGCRRL